MQLSLFPILAFGLTSPLLWWGLGLGSVPVVIHLLHKRKYRESQWAAMRFLLEAARKNARRLRLEQLLLLAVRMLVMLFIAAALRGTYDQAFGTYFSDSAPVHKIIVVDASASMGLKPADVTRFERAKEVARQIVEGTSRGDAINLLRVAGSDPRTIVRQPAYEKSEVIEEIEQLQLTDERGDVFATLQEVVELLREAPEIPSKQIVLVSDFQRTGWSPETGGPRAQIRQLLNTFSEQAALILVDVGQSAAQNAAVTSIVSAEPFAVAGQSIHLQVTARVYGVSALPAQVVELYVDDRLVETKTVDLSPGADARVDFTYSFSSSGEHRIEARLKDDALPLDNRRWLALPVKDELSVLLVNGTPAGQPADMATYHVELALAPSTVDRPTKSVMRPHVVDWGELSRVDLTRYDCVFLCNIELFTQHEAEILQTYVESGGGLIISLGNQVRPDNYNQLLYRDGEGILPAKLGDPVGDAEAREDAYTFDPENLEHPIVSAFQGNPGAGLEATLTFEYFSTTIPDDGRATVALRFNTQDAAIIDAPFGRGRTILITTALDKRWGTWAVFAPSFVPLMHESVMHAVAGRWRERQLLVGEPLATTFPTRVLIRSAEIKRPDGSEKTIEVSDGGDRASIAYDATDRAGIFTLTLGPPLSRTELFAVNVDPLESDLSKLDEQELQAELLPGVTFVYRTRWQEVERPAGMTVADRGGLARWFLLAALMLLLVEQLMAWNFFYGFVLLYAAVAFALVRQGMLYSGVVGSLLLVLVIVGMAAFLVIRRRRETAS